jgi:predicted Zn-dependent peptidase
VASTAFSALLFPADHPYHSPLSGDSASTAALDSATVRAYYDAHVRAGGARMIVTGDITPTEARLAVARRFRGWTGGATAAPPAPEGGAITRPATIYLVDKPEAAQSVIRIGGPGVERTNPDYYALAVMNTILGGSFSSRLNSILREEKGYTYGAGSGFQYDPVPGPFLAGSSVRTNVTDSSLAIVFQQLNEIRDMPVEPAELDRAKAYLALGLADQFETTGQMAGQVNELLTFGLPLRYYDDYVDRIMAVTAADVQRVAKQYLMPDQYTAVVVGDVAAIRAPIEALQLARVEVVDMFGTPVE